jgi:hypothetical protein
LRDLKPEFRAKTTMVMVGQLVMAELLVLTVARVPLPP